MGKQSRLGAQIAIGRDDVDFEARTVIRRHLRFNTLFFYYLVTDALTTSRA
jgi:hypothetical protein